jgi:uncharacterized membrane protein (DUF485 family)
MVPTLPAEESTGDMEMEEDASDAQRRREMEEAQQREILMKKRSQAFAFLPFSLYFLGVWFLFPNLTGSLSNLSRATLVAM